MSLSHRSRVAKGHTGALFLLILMAAFSKGCFDIQLFTDPCVLWLRLEPRLVAVADRISLLLSSLLLRPLPNRSVFRYSSVTVVKS